ncbi:MAG: UDP-N-acetylmuramate--L-alanine ligase [Oscillospiraceae bacterium]|jgi:UDP-N-acetylmuramate--alanine ligase|nr:UDP-N-acetylmuramate--L-alanine ligase [Oscillospiraceae bacterium]
MSELRALIQSPCHVHFIGIGGAGMCPLAEILHARGFTITGSDSGESETLERVRALGIPVSLPQSAENITGREDLIVFTAALLPDNPELVAAQTSGIPTMERSKLLGAMSEGYDNTIGVCGTHGKTTVTAMITHILLRCGKDPSAIIGGKLPLTQTNGISGSQDTMVVESCEYKDTFLDISPTTAVILNIDADHMEYFKTMENLRASFVRFARRAQTVIYNADDEHTRRAVAELVDAKTVSVGLGEECAVRAVDCALEKMLPRFTLVADGAQQGRVTLLTPGAHNVHNALAALTAAHLAGCSWAEAIDAVASFGGAGRRFEIMATVGGITIADDYAHHPKELEVTLNAAMGMGYRKVWAIFQPFTFSRTFMLLDDFARVLQIPDYTVLTEIKGSREVNTWGVHVSQLAQKMPGSVWYETFEETAQYVLDRVQPGDLVLTLGCGDPYKVGRMITEQMTEGR